MSSYDNLRNQKEELRIYRNRLLVAVCLVLLCMLLILARMVHLQIFQHEMYSTLSNKNRISIIPEGPVRGLIFDRNGQILATNLPTFNLEVIPEQVDDLADSLQRLGQLVHLSDKDLQKFERMRQRERRFKQILLRNQLTEQEIALFSVNQHLFPGFSIELSEKRYYPQGDALSHVIGYVGLINKTELEKIDTSNYRATKHIGKTGLERFYEDRLHGTTGYSQVETDASGRVVRGPMEKVNPEPGENLHLTLDLELQQLTDSLLQGRRGAIVALDPRDGGILALVSHPGFDPNLFIDGIDSQSYSELRDSPDNPLFNRALRGVYAPGSTIKPLMGLLGLTSGLITVHTKIWDPGYFSLPNDTRRYRDWKKFGHGSVDIFLSIAQSCDVFYYDLAVKLGIDRIHSFMSAFGFGHRTGLDMAEEKSGLMPSREWKRRVRKQGWYPGESVNTGIGQGYWSATPLQLAQSTALLVNGGRGFQPHLLKASESAQGLTAFQPEVVETGIAIRKEHLTTVLEGMHQVINSERGTAHKAFKGARYDAGGKTGTAQVVGIKQNESYDVNKVALRNRDNALFIGFAPFDQPKIVVAVIVENAGHGGSEAAPLARAVMDMYLTGKKTTAIEPTAAEPEEVND